MMNGGDLYELAKLLGHSNIKMTERYAKLGNAYREDRRYGARDVEVDERSRTRTTNRLMCGYCSVG
jgi:integrase